MIRGKIDFEDNSLLHLREFVYVEISIDRKMYSYQYMNSENKLIFRYDNTEHPEMLNVVTKLYIFKYSSIIKGKNVNIS